MNDSLIRKFFLNQCTEAEQQEVLQYFRNNPDELSQYITEEMWDQFEPQEKWISGKNVWLEIKKEIQPPLSVRSRSKLYLLAACTIGAILISIVAFMQYNNAGDKLANYALAETGSHLKIIYNNSQNAMLVHLPDSSVVTLYANGKLSYPENFEPYKRNIFLEGKAMFKVFKDKTRPFSVFAGNTVTTALGTIFWVDQQHDAQIVKVHLLEGKVVIKKFQHDSIGDELALLSPGNEFVYDPTSVIDNKATQKKQNNSIEHKQIEKTTAITTGKIFRFDKWPVSKVLDTLSLALNIDINYPKDELKNGNYTGVYNSSDMTINDFLLELSMLNGWLLKQTGTSAFRVVPVPGR